MKTSFSSILRVVILCALVSIARASDIAGGLLYTGEPVAGGDYQWSLGPSYDFSTQQALVSSRLRVPMNETMGFGLAFGVGDRNVHFGLEGAFFAVPRVASPIEFAFPIGVYYKRLDGWNHVVGRLGTLASVSTRSGAGRWTPYLGTYLVPSQRFTNEAMALDLRVAAGVRLEVADADGFQLWLEGLTGIRGQSEVVFAASYPFAAF